MIGKLPVLGALVAGFAILALCAFAMVDQTPLSLEMGQALTIEVSNAMTVPDLVHPNLVAALVIFGSLAGLTIVFFVFLMQPKAGRSIASRRRQASSEMIGRALDSLRGE